MVKPGPSLVLHVMHFLHFTVDPQVLQTVVTLVIYYGGLILRHLKSF